ncbi:MAG: dihydropteroate synthase [Candidatus Dadabacteria bacterium]|nr:dihydropteroate synthase [Candidatus Dadabacteria bacterium]
MKNANAQRDSYRFEFRDRALNLGRDTVIMGVLNVTPDSFYDGGRYTNIDDALRGVEAMVSDGAGIIDIGGESTRPGSTGVSEAEELGRVLPVVTEVCKRFEVPVSVDTTKAAVAEAALGQGASIINDISGLRFEPELACVVAKYKAGIVLMHSSSKPADMQKKTDYRSVVDDVAHSLRDCVERALQSGINPKGIVIDPGIGFGKTVEQNLVLIKNLDRFISLGMPILLGTSRKSFIGKVLDLGVEERLEGTAATVALAIRNGASIIRAHDVLFMTRVAKMIDSILAAC